jgi:bifunctional enzyme CysN/CysC
MSQASPSSSILRISTAGSVDDGKSTLIGRLLHDSGNVYDDHIAALEVAARKTGSSRPSLALLTDGLKAEREQGITIDVAYRYFSTPRRRFILADSPGHIQYTRNMATGASTADLTLILVDARLGILEQTKRHAFIASLLGVPRIAITINKMDLVNYDQSRFEALVEEFTDFAGKLGIREVKFIPISALEGDNVVTRSTRMPWYTGETVLEYLEHVYIAGDHNLVDFRFPVQYVINPDHNFRGYAGTVASGSIKVGEEILVLPSKARARVKALFHPQHTHPASESLEASAPDAVVMQLDTQIDISRGDMLVRPKNAPRVVSSCEAMLVWMSDEPSDKTKRYIIRHTSREAKAFISHIEYCVDIHTLSRTPPRSLNANDIARVTLTTTSPLFLDAYQRNRNTGNIILIDPQSFRTVAAGMIIERGASEAAEQDDSLAANNRNLHQEAHLVTQSEREERLGYRAATIWMTGLSGSGKSTIAKGTERELFSKGVPVFFLDGDTLRSGLNAKLGFSREDRSENLRRAAHVAALMNQAGITVICAFISPYAEDRERARTIIGSERFMEVHITAPLEVCESRDPHGLYAKARSGEISNFTGISDPYEPPSTPDLTLDTSSSTSIQNVAKLAAVVLTKLSL